MSFSAGLAAQRGGGEDRRAHGWGEDPVIVTGLATGAMALLWLGRFDEAERWLERAERTLHPDGEPGTELIVHYARRSPAPGAGSLEEALAALRAAERGWRRCWPASTHSRWRGGRACSRRRHAWATWPRRAAALADISEDESASTSDMRLAAAVIHLAEGEPEQAIDVLAPVIEGLAPALHRPSATTEAQVLDAVARDQLGDHACRRGIARARARARRARRAHAAVRRSCRSGSCSNAIPGTAPRTRRCSQTILDVLAGSAPTIAGERGPLLEELSEAELRVVRYLPSNLRAPEIAAELFVSTNTVRTHLRHIYAKLDAHGRAEAVDRARELGLLAPSLRR